MLGPTRLFPRRPARPVPRGERIASVALLGLLAAVVALFVLAGARAGPPGLAKPAAPSPGPLPLLSPAGWVRGELERFEPAVLFEKIDGKADAYLAFGVAGLVCATYTRPDAPGTFCDVYLYDMAEAKNAFGIYRTQRGGGERPLDDPDEACASGASAFVRRGRYYLEVVGSGEEEAGEVAALAGVVARALLDAGPRFDEPTYFPRDGLKRVRYVRENGLAIEGLDDAFLAAYEDGVQLVVAPGGAGLARTAQETLGFLDTPCAFRVVGGRIAGVVGARDAARLDALAGALAREDAQ